MNISPRERKLLTFAILVCAFLLSFNYIFLPQYHNLTKIKEEIKNKEKIVTDLATNSVKVDADIKKIENETTKMLAEIPYTKDTESLLNTLDDIVAKSGVQQVKINFEDEIKGPAVSDNKSAKNSGKSFSNYNIVPVNIDVKGSYESNLNFLKLLEASRRLFNYKAVNISAAQDGNVSMTVSLEYYDFAKDVTRKPEKIPGSGKSNPFLPLIKATPEKPTADNRKSDSKIRSNVSADVLNQQLQSMFESLIKSITPKQVIDIKQDQGLKNDSTKNPPQK